MNKAMAWSASAAAAVALAAAAAEGFTDRELKARFYYDLGAETIDVSAYPQKQQDAYKLFSMTCSQCHTLARPINAPIVSLKDWRRYARRMHLRAQDAAGAVLSKDDAKAIADFLAYDSKLRKTDKKAAFEAETKRLQARFEAMKDERRRRQTQQNKDKAVPSAPYTGTKP